MTILCLLRFGSDAIFIIPILVTCLLYLHINKAAHSNCVCCCDVVCGNLWNSKLKTSSNLLLGLKWADRRWLKKSVRSSGVYELWILFITCHIYGQFQTSKWLVILQPNFLHTRRAYFFFHLVMSCLHILWSSLCNFEINISPACLKTTASKAWICSQNNIQV